MRDVVARVEGSAPQESSDSIEVSWMEPAYTNGRALKHYAVFVCDYDRPSDCHVSQTQQTTKTVEALTPGRNYTVNVEAHNEVGGSGNTTTPQRFFTTYSVPQVPNVPVLGPPLVGLSNRTTIHAVWNRPFANGVAITSYDLRVDGVPGTLEASHALFPQHIFVNLIPGTVHNLSVQANNAKGALDSPTSQSLRRRPTSRARRERLRVLPTR